MRYLLQVIVMVSDVAVFAAVAGVVYFGWRSALVWLVVAFALSTWWKTGGFEAWRPSVVRRFLRNAKEVGL